MKKKPVNIDQPTVKISDYLDESGYADINIFTLKSFLTLRIPLGEVMQPADDTLFEYLRPPL